MKKTLQFSFLLLLVSVVAFAQSDKNWKRTTKQNINSTVVLKEGGFSESSLYFNLNLDSFRQSLLSVKESAAPGDVIIAVPNINGEMEQYKIWENSNFTPELQKQFPEIRAYAGIGIADKTASIRISLDPKGIQLMVLRADKKTEFMEPYTADGKSYALFNSTRNIGEMPFICSTEDKAVADELGGVNRAFSNNRSFKTLRLALSCTAEYTTFHGGTVAGALAAMNATMTRVNGVFDIDLAVKLLLIQQQTSIIYTNAATDPYSPAGDPSANGGNGDGLGASGAWTLELQNNLTNTIGNAAYDIGHLFGASGGGGNAGCIGCVCVDPTIAVPRGKGNAFTSPYNSIPQGDLFDIDYVAHEMGHQLGANHTFSHSAEINGVNVEPGSGSTIMGYAGITNYNVQENSDDYFTYRSILQIQTNLATKSCPVSAPMANTPPTVSAGADFTIPKGTPFILTGTGSDTETNSAVKYTWEQNDPATAAVTGANSVASPTKVVGPTFRSLPPSASPVRYFPALNTVLSNALSSTYESVSTVGRRLNFTLTARDYGVGGGQTNTDEMVVNVSGFVGPFDVTSQNVEGISWSQGSTQTITWAVNNTAGLVGSANVDILLSTDGGLTFPVTLKSNTPNDGSESIIVPNVAAPYCRIMVKPTGNIFYDINPVPFAIGYIVTKTCNTYTNNVVTNIPDNTTAFSVSGISIPTASTISDVKIAANITHTYLSDLHLAVLSPNSTQVNLMFQQCAANDNLNVTFSDAGTDIACASPTTGTYKPYAPLSALNGGPANGTWTFGFRDLGVGDVGTLNSWSVTICSETVALSTENFGLANFKIYPNPNNGNFTVQFDSNSGNDIKVAVHDIRGRQIFDKSYANNGLFSENLSLSNVQAGIYLVTVQDGERKEVKKIVIE